MSMSMNSSIKRLSVDSPRVYAFEISGEVSAEEMEAMANTMNDAFDSSEEKVDMVLVFRDFQGSEGGSLWDGDVIASRFRAITNVDKYVVVGAPDSAENMITMFSKLMPVEAHTFELSEIDRAWALVGVTPPSTAP